MALAALLFDSYPCEIHQSPVGDNPEFNQSVEEKKNHEICDWLQERDCKICQ